MGEGRDRREQILEAAFGEFSERGFRGATIKGIAEAAGLQSPALIYWYFEDKEALFREAIRSRVPLLQTIRDPEALLDRPPEEVLAEVGRAFFSTADATSSRQLLRLMIGESTHHPKVAELFFQSGLGRALRFLELYLERQAELGRLRPHDARSGARAFVGMLFVQMMGKAIVPQLLEGAPPDEDYLQDMVGIFLEGLRLEGR
ncbi:TetR/AcrR family transcriptional regulator [Rubrobacter calidifluminis]|uniref:TetR/AcrR family transcriptional regulator n=1 Tax=Rubrobacter calidifluminis TaxID=1392640 RepID=UPI0023628784|nr:TetR/AcrR family transcriptional regulator [Rubrobacter calidifluminis]